MLALQLACQCDPRTPKVGGRDAFRVAVAPTSSQTEHVQNVALALRPFAKRCSAAQGHRMRRRTQRCPLCCRCFPRIARSQRVVALVKRTCNSQFTNVPRTAGTTLVASGTSDRLTSTAEILCRTALQSGCDSACRASASLGDVGFGRREA